MSFDTLALHPALLSAVNKAGFTEPTPVQLQAIPAALAGEDLMVSAQTGSGKTAAFMLPSMHRLLENPPAPKSSGVSILVLTPTRELALQVAQNVKLLGTGMRDLRVAVVVGGMPYGAQIKSLSRRVDVLVATPGRLIDHLQSGRVKLNTVQTLVLDEADRMLDMGFIDDIHAIVAKTPRTRQTLLFSATLEDTVSRLASDMLNQPKRIEVSGHKSRHENITQTLLYADDDSHKRRLLDHLLRDADMNQAIVFTATKRGAEALADDLRDEGFAARSLHGDMNQRQRNHTLGLLQRGGIRVLVATDVAARGIDVKGISHAINYDLPMQAEDYTHRIGRTGRAGQQGAAYTLATHSEHHKVRRIERFTEQTIEVNEIPGLEPVKKLSPKKKRPGSGARRPGGFSGKPRKPNGAAGASAGRGGNRSPRSNDRGDRGDRHAPAGASGRPARPSNRSGDRGGKRPSNHAGAAMR